MKCKQSLALLLTGTMLLPANAFAADLSQFKDFPNDWSAKPLERAIDDGLLNGSNGQINAKGLLTRAQMAAIVARAFGAVKTASLSSYKDVLPSAWYYSDMGKAVQMQAFQGADGLLHPDQPITRQEAFAVLARAFSLPDGKSSSLSSFSDGDTVSSWATGSVAALVENGYVSGTNGRLNPKNNITRAEFAKVITEMAEAYIGAEAVSGKTVDGNVIVRESGASLSNVTINGDLIIADSADKVSLDNVKVTGRIVIRGGANSVSATNTTTGKGVLVDSPNGAASLSVSGGSIGTVTVKSDLSLSGSVGSVAITDKATLTVNSGASVGTVTVSAAGAKVTGTGKVTNVQANANNVTVTNNGTKVTAGSGVSGVKAGNKTVESGKTETVGAASTSTGGSSGGSSGGNHSTTATYVYAYAAVPYSQYWQNEGVYLKDGANWNTSSDEADNDSYSYNGLTLSEHDKGAFDAVSRATARHGIHRGSFQQEMVFHTTEKVDLEVAYWNNGTSLVLTDGRTAEFKTINSLTSHDDPIAEITVDGTTYHMTGSELMGIKYVPVKVKESDFEAFKKAYTVVENGSTLTGGYTEGKLIGFHDDTALTADVTANTNGLKEVTRNSDGSFSFGARQTGSDSGVKDTALKTVDASKIIVTPQTYSGDYGESLRVHLTGDAYGDLGSRMQTVEWKFYGDKNPDTDSTAKPLATYGTKFAADNWMHKGNGIQLGLTDSERCNISDLENHGAGYWTATIYALGYHDFTVTVNVTAENLPKPVESMTAEQKTQLTQLKDTAKALLDDKDNSEYSTVSDKVWSDLLEHYNEAAALLESADATSAKAEELLGELPELIAPVKLAPVTATYTALFPVLTSTSTPSADNSYHDYWNTKVKAFFEEQGYTVSDTVAEQYAEYLRTVCSADIYGQDAMDKYGDGSNGFQFDCAFINGVDTIQFDGSKISGTKDGQEVFSHQYTYQGEVTVGEGEMSFTGDLYKTSDENAGEFTYFIMRDDTPGKTQHIEFRYGSDLNELKGYVTGKYAYWLAAGIPVNSDEAFVKKCIDLFVTENLDGVDPRLEAPSISGMELAKDWFSSYYLMSFDGTDKDLDTYLNKITKITINDTEYPKSSYTGYSFQEGEGGYGLDVAIKFNNTDVFDKDGDYEIVISADGYQDVKYTYTKGNGGSTDPVQPTVETKTATLPIITDQTTAGSTKRYRGDDYNITVTVTLSDGKITNVAASSTAGEDDEEYFATLTDESFFNKFKNILSTDTDSIDKIDAVSGATYSSATVKQAVKNALK